jgi:WD40 repeat protein/DNA-binding SARP family transcriptional activator
MARLSLSLLGPFQAIGEEKPVTGFESNKVKALLAYLATEADRPHPRETLAGLLWPDYPDRSALSNLRSALANLRQAIGDRQAEPPFLLITRDTIQFNPASDYALDILTFQNPAEQPLDPLEQAVAACRGSFLEGFFLSDSPPFEEWLLVKREQLNRHMQAALHRLAAHYEEGGEYERAITYARKQLELEPWDEPAHRQLMRALALNGQRSAALAQYETCCRLLAQELGVEPSYETTALYESIRDQLLAPARRPDAPATPEGAPAQTVRGYELLEQIGQGAFGVIYRARQRHVERQVAIKVILPEHANQPDFIRRFEAEAQLVAQLEHLHIVPLYDYWREPGGAYLVMRLMKGGSLEKLLNQGPLELSETARIVDQIGSALAAAHRQGVIHRDLKPANILLDEEGNAYLSDFGIAKASMRSEPAHITATGVIVGTPAYISPEQLQSQVLTPQADIYSLGVLLFEMLTGQHPFKGSPTGDLIIKHLTSPLPLLREARPDFPVELDRVIQRATAKDPPARYADVMSLVADLGRALAPETAPQPVTPAHAGPLAVTNPYKGLRAFQEADTLDFFGREALLEQLLAQLAASPTPGENSRFLAVVGPSGSGKSSLVKAGLLPAIRRGALPGSDQWFVVEMLPGSHPLEELEIALLRIAARQHSGLMEQLRRDARGLIRAARLVLPADDSTLLLIVDQFEELFTLAHAADKSEAAHFMDSLYAAVTDPRSPVRVIITLRADFYDRPLTHPDFSALMSQRTQVVTPLTTDELARAIAGPAERVGAALETGLVTDIVTDVKDQPGALPLLQYALTELFERRDGRLLTRQAYQSIGGVMGALGRRAEEVYTGLTEAGQAAARQVFLRLITLGEGSEDTRRRVLRSELESLAPPIPDLQSPIPPIIEAFGKSRLLSFDRDPLTRGPMVEVAHEALLREWQRLREWLDASRADVRLQRLLAAAAAEWTSAGHEPSFLLQGARLAQFEGWAEDAKLALTQEERAFLEASLAERQKREAEEAARQRRELEAAQTLAEAQRQRAEEQAQAASKLRQRAIFLALALGASIVLLLVAVWLGQLANRNAQAAQEQARLATSRELAAAAVNNLQVDPERSVLLALHALDKADTLEARNSLHQALPELHILRTIPAHKQAPGVAFSPGGARLASMGVDGTAKVWDAATGQELLTLPGEPGDFGLAVAFSPDGKLLATGFATKVIVWDAATGQKLFTLAGESIGPTITHIGFSPDGQRLAAANMDGVPKVWDLTTRAEVFSLTGHEQPCDGIAYSPDGRLLATGDEEGIAKIWDAATGQELLTLRQSGVLHSVAFSPDSARLASANEDGTLKVWDSATGKELLSLRYKSGLYDVAFMPDGQRLVTGHQDGTTQIWDAVSGQQLLTLAGHASTVVGVAVSPDGKRIATGGFDGTVRIWEAAPGRELLTLAAHDDQVYDAVYSPDGTRLGTVSLDGTAKLWDPVSGQMVLSLTTGSLAGGLTGLAFSPDGQRLATGSLAGPVNIWDIGAGQAVMTLTGHTYIVPGLAFSPDGTRLATTSWDGTAKVWDLASGREIVAFTEHLKAMPSPPPILMSVAFSPDGKRVFTGGGDGYVREWDSTTGQELRTFSGEELEVYGIALSPSGKLLAMGLQNGVVMVWDVVSGKKLLQLSGHAGLIPRLAFNQDETRLASASFDGFAKVWDVQTGQELMTLYGNTSNVFGVSFSPDSTRLATAGGDGTVRIYTLNMAELTDLARSRVTRALTTEECRRYFHLEQCPSDLAEHSVP